jgi:hypothetical protein
MGRGKHLGWIGQEKPEQRKGTRDGGGIRRLFIG